MTSDILELPMHMRFGHIFTCRFSDHVDLNADRAFVHVNNASSKIYIIMTLSGVH